MDGKASKYVTVYVQLLGEGSAAYRPVPAVMLNPSVCILDGADIYDPDDEKWEFLPGSQVTVEKKQLSAGEVLVAVGLN